jgi:hypothetical protein
VAVVPVQPADQVAATLGVVNINGVRQLLEHMAKEILVV